MLSFILSLYDLQGCKLTAALEDNPELNFESSIRTFLGWHLQCRTEVCCTGILLHGFQNPSPAASKCPPLDVVRKGFQAIKETGTKNVKLARTWLRVPTVHFEQLMTQVSNTKFCAVFCLCTLILILQIQKISNNNLRVIIAEVVQCSMKKNEIISSFSPKYA